MANESGMLVGASEIPSPMDIRGEYLFDPPAIVGQNGEGLDVEAGGAVLTWAWPWLTKTDYTFWTQTLLAGAASVAVASLTVYDADQELTAYGYAVIHRPRYRKIQSGLYYDVTLKIDQIRDEVTP